MRRDRWYSETRSLESAARQAIPKDVGPRQLILSLGNLMNSTSPQEVTLSREELYQRVWSTSMHKLAPSFGLSDVGFKKLCDRYNVPTPSRGHWAKKRAGKTVRRTPLPVELDPARQVIDLSYDPNPQPREKPAPPPFPVKDPELIALVEREKTSELRITVPDTLRNPHPAVARLRDQLTSEARPDQFSLLRARRGNDGVDIAVGAQSVTRVLRLLNALLRALERRGWIGADRKDAASATQDTEGVRCSVLGEQFGLMVREKLRMIHLSPEERKDRYFSPSVRYEPKGIFELSITGTHGYAIETWRDGKKAKVEDQLNDVMIGLLVAVERNRERREEQRHEEERRRLAEAARRERERLEQLERERIARFEGLADRWAKTERLRAFLDAVKVEAARRQLASDAESGFARWVEWAEEHVRTVDPLGPGRKLPVY